MNHQLLDETVNKFKELHVPNFKIFLKSKNVQGFIPYNPSIEFFLEYTMLDYEKYADKEKVQFIDMALVEYKKYLELVLDLADKKVYAGVDTLTIFNVEDEMKLFTKIGIDTIDTISIANYIEIREFID